MNLKNFKFNSKCPIDKIVLLAEMYAPNITAVSTPHGLSETPLILGIWSTDQNFSSTRNCGMIRTGIEPVLCWATNTNLFVQNYAYEGRPVWVRIYGILPAGSKAAAPSTNSRASKFVFNSKFRYMPMVGSYTVTGEQTISHNLGYKPRVLAWMDYGGSDNHIEPLAETKPISYPGNFDPSITVTDNAVKVIPSNGGYNIHLRIYA